jgi:hypothetical protein
MKSDTLISQTCPPEIVNEMVNEIIIIIIIIYLACCNWADTQWRQYITLTLLIQITAM